ncbi:unnamed protein product [Dovyalis caffra]|uniref:Uncharacterized protein n=1 Tax=Dovyalis caffra TaxID=77055 RepID=A0AAV1RYK8_9ROSI|nr:unnamed protein product [Dovyalis caffra]
MRSEESERSVHNVLQPKHAGSVLHLPNARRPTCCTNENDSGSNGENDKRNVCVFLASRRKGEDGFAEE